MSPCGDRGGLGIADEARTMDTAEVVILIVGYKNADDIARCLEALSRASQNPQFDILICENGDFKNYQILVRRLVAEGGCCAVVDNGNELGETMPSSFVAIQRLELISNRTKVIIGCANENLGYGGGVNVWLRWLADRKGWKGVWILNPDTEPAPGALHALVARAEEGGKGMVGSTILDAGSENIIRFRGGLHWNKLMARSEAIGFAERLDAPIDLALIERTMDSPSGASMYVTRRCVEQIGLMDESYFLFFEDLDWGTRAKKTGLGYACNSIVVHQRGTTTGSAGLFSEQSRLSVYLQHRNAINFVRRYHPLSIPILIISSLFHSVRFLIYNSPKNSKFVIDGLIAGLCGESGIPDWYKSPRQ